ncbi:hypothetical protein [Paraglaciecola arctica]|uniref:hypothetical protein n=1 Tax=Paraglaciecola arctica TaxID=1128911 RepID=UPI001C06AB86|nr:hypothetical protein [Paraglaciecola arctica]MBU3004213.1 hypothetical protein [Paraglaciecola arctica]
MMKKHNLLTLKQVWLLPLMLLGLTAFDAQSDTGKVTTTVSQFLITDGNYGNCMAKLDVSPRSELPQCGNHWVSFSCDGTYQSKDIAYRMLDTTQMAAVLDKEVTIHLDDSRRHNSFCLATRVDFIP